MKRSPRVRLGLLLAPFLLLVPLGALKWRSDWLQDYPPLSKMDKTLRAALDQAPWIRVSGGSPTWRALSGLSDETIIVKDKSVLPEMERVLRCSQQEKVISSGQFKGAISVQVPHYNSLIHRVQWKVFLYFKDEKSGTPRAYLWKYDPGNSVSMRSASVQPHFVPRFEALVAALARRAQAKGKHPDVTLMLEPNDLDADDIS